MRNFRRLVGALAGVWLIMLGGQASAQSSIKKGAPNGGGYFEDVTTVLTAHSSDAIFKSAASYTFSVKNNLDKTESGKISYIVTDQFNKKLLSDSIQVSLGPLSSKNCDFNIPETKPGFYKINFMINVTDDDDTTRRVFGIRPEEVKSAHPKPHDFDKFWDDTKSELAAIDPNYKVTEKPEMEDGIRKVYLIEMQSLGNLTIRGWLTIPLKHPKHRKFPVLLMLPGYQASNKPLMGPEYETAFITLDVRGQGMNREDMQMRREDYIVNGLEDKNRYILRGIIADCLRCMDFIFSRDDFNHDEIAVTGGSMGGYLAITTAALDKRVTFCAPQNPFMSDIYDMDNGAVTWPINHMKDYVKIRPGLTFDKVLDNLQYFDTKNFATEVTCPVDMGMGLLDPFVPPNNSYIVYNNFPAKKKKLFVFKDLGHEVGDSYYRYETLWVNDMFALF